MKKTLILIMSLLFALTSCDTIAKTSEIISNNISESQVSIPFVTFYNEPDNKINAKLSYWDLDNGLIEFTNQVIYSAVPTPQNDYVEPIIWDGERLLLHKTSLQEDAFKNTTEIIKNYTLNTIYGTNIEAKRNTDSDGIVKDYSLILYGDNEKIEKKVAFLFKDKDDNNNEIVVGEQDIPSCVSYDNKTGEITFIFKYPFETHFNLYIAKCNIADTDNIKWDEIELSEEIETGGNYTPYPSNSALIGSKYYIQSHLSLAVVDLETKKSKVLDDIIKECFSLTKGGNFSPSFPMDIMPVGVYKDILVLSVPVSTEDSVEYLMCAFRESKLLGAIHLKIDDTWEVFDSNKKVKSKINIKDKNLFKTFNRCLLFFPFSNNVM